MKTRRMLSLALALAFCLALLPALPAQAAGFDGGSGTKNDPYIISTAEQLSLFRDMVNGGQDDICAQVVDNLDMKMQDWVSIGLSAQGYRGTFDGNGYAIRNLKIDRFSTGTSTGTGSTLYGGGLFGIVGRGGVVRHVNVDGVVSADTSVSTNPDIGAVCGGNMGTVEECFSTCDVRDFNLTVNSVQSGHVNVGGVVGYNAGVVRNCYMVGDMDVQVQGQGFEDVNVGGVVAKVGAGGATIENCYSVVTIKAQSSQPCYTGGMIGSLEAEGTFRNLYTREGVSFLGRNTAGQVVSSGLPSDAELKDSAMPGKLGNAFAMDKDQVNQGYPVLAVMAYQEQANQNNWYTTELTSYQLPEEIVNQLVPLSLWNRDLRKNVTRAEFASISLNLYEMLTDQQVSADIENPFVDVSSDDVIKAYQLGITKGTSATTFDPYSYISRQDMATMMARMYKKAQIQGWTLETDSQYQLEYDMPAKFRDDSLIASYAYDSVYFMSAMGIFQGDNNGYFRPKAATDLETVGYATREQAIIASIRYYNKNK